MEVADDGSGQPQSDLGQLAGTQLAHGYESPQVGQPHQVGRESLDGVLSGIQRCIGGSLDTPEDIDERLKNLIRLREEIAKARSSSC